MVDILLILINVSRDIVSNPLLDGVTISGGEPFLQIQPLLILFRLLKQQHIHIMIYSGYTFEEIVCDDEKKKLLSFCDVLVDGKFILALKNRDLYIEDPLINVSLIYNLL